MPDGEYQLGDFPVRVANGRAMIGDALAGSVLTLDKALRNFVEFTGASVQQGLRLMTANPAAMTGFGDRGSLTLGGLADFVAVDSRGSLLAAVVGGVAA
jgi:N-acetylglucosamine-6-phosphate deacetylase